MQKNLWKFIILHEFSINDCSLACKNFIRVVENTTQPNHFSIVKIEQESFHGFYVLSILEQTRVVRATTLAKIAHATYRRNLPNRCFLLYVA